MSGHDLIREAERDARRRDVGSIRALGASLSVERVMRLVQSQATSDLNPLDLTFAGWHALVALSYSKHKKLPTARIAQRLGGHAATLTKTIDRLERAGYVRRGRHDGDRRVVVVELTKEGERAERKATKARSKAGFGYDALTETELNQLVELLAKVRSSHGEEWSEAPEDD